MSEPFKPGEDHSYYGGPGYENATKEQCAELDKRFRDAAVDTIARAICREDCAFRGEPPCWEIDPDHWPPPTCDEPGCMAFAVAAFFANLEKPDE